VTRTRSDVHKRSHPLELDPSFLPRPSVNVWGLHLGLCSAAGGGDQGLSVRKLPIRSQHAALQPMETSSVGTKGSRGDRDKEVEAGGSLKMGAMQRD
jgi:hypothetical protein